MDQILHFLDQSSLVLLKAFEVIVLFVLVSRLLLDHTHVAFSRPVRRLIAYLGNTDARVDEEKKSQ